MCGDFGSSWCNSYTCNTITPTNRFAVCLCSGISESVYNQKLTTYVLHRHVKHDVVIVFITRIHLMLI